MSDYVRHYRELIAEIERDFPVATWRCGDLDLWPLARVALHHDMHGAATGEIAPRRRAGPLRAIALLARPLLILWRARHDFSHLTLRPRRSRAILLGDGVSLDFIDAAFQDRFGEPVVAVLEEAGCGTFLMQPGDLSRLPWRRPTFPAGLIQAWAALLAPLFGQPLEVPGHTGVMELLGRAGVVAPGLLRQALAARAREVRAGAWLFGLLLARVRPELAFVVTYYVGLGPAFLLACRRRGLLSIDLQHCPQEGAPQAYAWQSVPAGGYSTLPKVFWCWSAAEAAAILPPHHGLAGGHAQAAPYLDEANPRGREGDARIATLAAGAPGERNILVALQPIAGRQETWNALATAMAAAPQSWRWWIRRHPAARAWQDVVFGRLLLLRQPNIIIDAPLPLPALLRHMDALVSLRSGCAAEAAMFAVPSLFLDPDAPFPSLLAQGAARAVTPETILSTIAALPPRHLHSTMVPPPPLATTLAELKRLA